MRNTKLELVCDLKHSSSYHQSWVILYMGQSWLKQYQLVHHECPLMGKIYSEQSLMNNISHGQNNGENTQPKLFLN